MPTDVKEFSAATQDQVLKAIEEKKGVPIEMDAAVKRHIDEVWSSLGF